MREGRVGSVAQFCAAIDPLCAVRVAHNWSQGALTDRAVVDLVPRKQNLYYLALYYTSYRAEIS